MSRSPGEPVWTMRRSARFTSALLTLVLLASACGGGGDARRAAGAVGVRPSTTSPTSALDPTGVATTTTAVSLPDAPDPRVSATGGVTGAAPLPTAPPATSSAVDLYSGSANTRGITKDKIVLCAHAVLTNGPAFDATPEDFNVYYDTINDEGGIYGRKIEATYENDNDDAATA